MDVRMTTAPSLVLACVFYANDTSVGIVSVLFTFGFFHNLLEDRRIGSTLSFYINSRIWSRTGKQQVIFTMKIKPKNFFKAYENAIEKLDRKWFGADNTDYNTSIAQNLRPMLVIALVALIFLMLNFFFFLGLSIPLPLLLMLTATVMFIRHTVSLSRRNRAAGIKTNYFRQYAIVLILSAIYLYIIDCRFPLWGHRVFELRLYIEFMPGIIHQILWPDTMYFTDITGPVPGIVIFFNDLVNDPLNIINGLLNYPGFYAYSLSRLCFIAIWVNHLYLHWGNLSTSKQKIRYVFFSWFFMTVGAQLFSIAMILCYLLYLAGCVLLWIFISLTSGRPAAKSKEYELEDGTKVKEENGLLGEKSYRGSDGAFYKTSDSGKTFTKE